MKTITKFIIGDAKNEGEKDEITEQPQTKQKGKKGQKKVEKEESEEVQDTGEPVTKRRRKADDKGN